MVEMGKDEIRWQGLKETMMLYKHWEGTQIKCMVSRSYRLL